MTSLDLHHNDITAIDVDAIENCTLLKNLDLTNNLLTEVPQALFTTFERLESLILRRNLLTAPPSNLLTAKNLSRLDLRSNRLHSLSAVEWSALASVRSVDLGRNNLSALPTLPERFTPARAATIVELDLTTNALASLDGGALSLMKTLKRLKLPRNHLAVIAKEHLAGLTELVELDLSRNPIAALASLTFSEAAALLKLNLARCSIALFEDGVFYGLTKLRELNLSHNQIKAVTEGWLFGLSALETLDLSSNLITTVDNHAWTQVPALRTLNLANNRIRSLPSGAFHPLRRLESLNLASNLLEAVHKTAMAGLDELASLDVSSNQLAAIIEDAALLQGTLPALTRLNFAANGLRQIPARAFQRFSSVSALDLRDNELTSIAEFAFEPLKLQKLQLNTSGLLCDCTLAWFAPWLFSVAGGGVDRASVAARCAFPEPLAELDLVAIDTSNLTCGAVSPRPLLLAHPPPLQTALVGGEARFGCTARGAAPLIVEWSVIEAGRARPLEGDDLSTIIQSNSTISEDGEAEALVSTLLFTGVTLDDRAEYQCVARNLWGADYSNRSVLDVQQVPKLTTEPDDVSMLAGGNARIECAAVGLPRPSIRWHKDGGASFPAADEKRLHVRPGDDSIYIMTVRKEDAGVYTCVAGNAAGAAQASATLRVYDNIFHSSATRISVASGDAAVLDCTCDVQSGQRIEWTKDGQRLVPDAVVVAPLRAPTSNDSDADTSELKEERTARRSLRAGDQIFIVLEVTAADGGRYECELMVGSERLATRVMQLVVDGQGGGTESDDDQESSSPAHALPLSIGFSTETSDGQIAALLLLTATLTLFVSVGAVWVLVAFRRTAHRLNNFPFREEG